MARAARHAPGHRRQPGGVTHHPVKATGDAGSDRSGRTFEAVRNVVHNGDGNGSEAGKCGAIGKRRNRRRDRSGQAARGAMLAGVGRVIGWARRLGGIGVGCGNGVECVGRRMTMVRGMSVHVTVVGRLPRRVTTMGRHRLVRGTSFI